MATQQSSILIWQKDRSEIEFLFPYQGDIIPLEVKSGQITRAKSLKKYIQLYQPVKSVIFSAKNMHVDHKTNMYHLPLYLSEKLMDIISE